MFDVYLKFLIDDEKKVLSFLNIDVSKFFLVEILK